MRSNVLHKCASVFEHTFARIPGAVKVYFPSGPGAGIVALTTVTVVRATSKDVRYFMVGMMDN